MNCTAQADVLPTNPTVQDCRRLGAIVSLARFQVRSDDPWDPEETAEVIYNSLELRPFRLLARLAVTMARDPRYKSPAVIHHAAAGVIAL